MSPVSGGSAEKAGIEKRDRLIWINGAMAGELTNSAISKMVGISFLFKVHYLNAKCFVLASDRHFSLLASYLGIYGTILHLRLVWWHVFRLQDETGAPGGNQHEHWENIQTLDRKYLYHLTANPGILVEATVCYTKITFDYRASLMLNDCLFSECLILNIPLYYIYSNNITQIIIELEHSNFV